MLYEILCADNVVESINNNLEYLLKLIPEIGFMIDFDQKNPHHHLDVWNHTLLALSKSANDFDVRLVLLFHDIGKPFSCKEVDGIRHFPGHPQKSAQMTKVILTRLGFDNDYINKICLYVKNHDDQVTDDIIKDNYEYALKLYEIQKCDALAHHPDKLEHRKLYISKFREKL